VIIGKERKNIPASEDPLDYVLGYSIGNDVLSRYWQDATRSSGQHGYGKSMDKFSPIGPVIVSRDVMTDFPSLEISTHVNGEVRQHSTTASMIFDVPTLIRHLSRGIALRPGTIIMTGTPDGVAAFMKPSPWLKNGDVVEIDISGIGKIGNRMSFEDENSQPPDDRPPGF
jgi:2-keto-4-pentenoate hydratase/2-oxohepta-3-ene-1,7-dioic acid hydratase in catechol pathway